MTFGTHNSTIFIFSMLLKKCTYYYNGEKFKLPIWGILLWFLICFTPYINILAFPALLVSYALF